MLYCCQMIFLDVINSKWKSIIWNIILQYFTLLLLLAHVLIKTTNDRSMFLEVNIHLIGVVCYTWKVSHLLWIMCLSRNTQAKDILIRGKILLVSKKFFWSFFSLRWSLKKLPCTLRNTGLGFFCENCTRNCLKNYHIYLFYNSKKSPKPRPGFVVGKFCKSTVNAIEPTTSRNQLLALQSILRAAEQTIS